MPLASRTFLVKSAAVVPGSTESEVSGTQLSVASDALGPLGPMTAQLAVMLSGASLPEAPATANVAETSWSTRLASLALSWSLTVGSSL